LVIDDGSPDGTALIVKELQQNFQVSYLLKNEKENWD
jgi:glycosyltransferase involved in cell wall biosynthesis